jgi:ketosteroid isomerase-like protein
MDVEVAARRWAEVWSSAWPARDTEAIAALYAELECWFGAPVAAGNRAAVEWWGTWVERGERLTLAGATLLRFGVDGKVVDQRDYWNEVERREPPYAGW